MGSEVAEPPKVEQVTCDAVHLLRNTHRSFLIITAIQKRSKSWQCHTKNMMLYCIALRSSLFRQCVLEALTMNNQAQVCVLLILSYYFGLEEARSILCESSQARP